MAGRPTLFTFFTNKIYRSYIEILEETGWFTSQGYSEMDCLRPILHYGSLYAPGIQPECGKAAGY